MINVCPFCVIRSLSTPGLAPVVGLVQKPKPVPKLSPNLNPLIDALLRVAAPLALRLFEKDNLAKSPSALTKCPLIVVIPVVFPGLPDT